MTPTPATAAARHARPLLQNLQPGQSVAIELPDRPFWAREAANLIRGTARYVIGAGKFRTSVLEEPGKIVVRRT